MFCWGKRKKKRKYNKLINNPRPNKKRKTSKNNKKYKKKKIPKAIREQVWVKYIGKKFNSKCYISWCKNDISVFDFHVGHNIPESKGGKLTVNNLRPICARCNLSMSSNFTIKQWDAAGKKKSSWCIIC
jgi:5-methylcytosine-specific restriction endonuclease McrA